MWCYAGDLNIGILVAALHGALRPGVGGETVLPGVSLLSLEEATSMICNVCLSVAALEVR